MSIGLPEWRVEPGLLDYPVAVATMETRAAAVRGGTARELIWLVEHPPLYTAGTSARAADLLQPDRFPVFATGRGGQYTYHGPGQRVVYAMLDLERRGRDLRRYVGGLEHWIVAALDDLGIAGRVIGGKVGVWVDGPAGPAKIAAIGVRVRRWVSFHGFAVNVMPDLSHYAGIVPCGLAEPVTSIKELRETGDFGQLDDALRHHLGTFLADLSTG